MALQSFLIDSENNLCQRFIPYYFQISRDVFTSVITITLNKHCSKSYCDPEIPPKVEYGDPECNRTIPFSSSNITDDDVGQLRFAFLCSLVTLVFT